MSFFLIFIVCLVVFIIFIKRRKKKRERKCPKCGTLGAMEFYENEMVDTAKSTIKKELKTRDKNGNVVKRRETLVPATIYTYRNWRRCKKCGYKDYSVEREKKEN